MDFVMLPAQALQVWLANSAKATNHVAGQKQTCVIPSARHSSSHSNFKVPFDESW